jgi:flagellar hook assembly protein FlgD
MGTHGYIEWDGTDDRGAVVETGYYLIIAEMFGTDGTTQRFKSKVVVATREH